MANFHSYTPAQGHGLKHDPFKALISPRPIGWISSVSEEGAVNLAPYSFFNALCSFPPMVGFASDGFKDSVANIAATGGFVHNLVGGDLLERMNVTSGNYPHGVSEMEKAGLTAVASDIVAAPRVAEAPASMECKLIEIKRLKTADGVETESYLTIGEVVRIHIDARFIEDGMVDEPALNLCARLGYQNYTSISEVFALRRPKI